MDTVYLGLQKILSEIKYPGFSRDIISFGILKNVTINNDDIELLLSINTDDQKIIDQIVNAIKIKINEFDPKYNLKINISSNQQPISEKKLAFIKNKLLSINEV